jgi:hypothetical protein
MTVAQKENALRYVPLETYTTIANDAQGIANTVIFSVPFTPTGLIAQIFSVTTGAANVTGLAVTGESNTTTGNYDVTIAATDIVAGDRVTLIAFK